VACNKVWLYAFFCQHSPGRDGNGEDCGLGNFGKPELIFGAFEAKLRELLSECFVGLFKCLPGERIFFSHIFAHSNSLRSLARKEKSNHDSPLRKAEVKRQNAEVTAWK
jgi:hypothetical protein